MAITYAYPTVTPELQDLLVGTEMAEQGGEDAPRTRTFTIGSVAELAAELADKTIYKYANNTAQIAAGRIYQSSTAIPASSLTNGDFLLVDSTVTFAGPLLASTNVIWYIHTSPIWDVNAVQIATGNAEITEMLITMNRNFWILNGYLNGRNFSTPASFNGGASNYVRNSTQMPTTFYIIVSCTTVGADRAAINSLVVRKT